MKNIPLSSTGEFKLLGRIQRSVAPGRGARSPLVIGNGDDAFAGRLTPGHVLVSTTDLLVENIHFRRDWASPQEIGYKAMAVNLSDLAAMGKCRPLFGLVGLAMPGDTTVDFVDKLYTGMNKISRKYGLIIAGGDTVSSRKDIVISITLIGEAKEGCLVARSGARPGDLIIVTGTFGDSGAGLSLLAKGKRNRGYLIRKHLLPEPRFDAALALTATGKLTSMIDSSDGLAASVRFIAGASGTGAEIDLEKVPLSPAMREWAAREKNADPVKLALDGGEDYELVFTAQPSDYPRLKRLVPGITAVGRITRGKKITCRLHGAPREMRTAGYQHFS